MKKGFKVIQLNGISGIILALLAVCAILGSIIILPVYGIKFLWNTYISEGLLVQTIRLSQASLLLLHVRPCTLHISTQNQYFLSNNLQCRPTHPSVRPPGPAIPRPRLPARPSPVRATIIVSVRPPRFYACLSTNFARKAVLNQKFRGGRNI